jgi:AraC family transcriptional regulator
LHAVPADGSIDLGASVHTEGAFALAGFACSLLSLQPRDEAAEAQVDIHSSRHVFSGGCAPCNGISEYTLDGKRRASGRLNEPWGLLVPQGHRWRARHKGPCRFVRCRLEQSAFALMLGEELGDFELKPYFGPNPIAPGLMERLKALCLASDEYPRIYAESLAALLIVEIFRTSATKQIPRKMTADVGPARFTAVLEFVEQHLECDLGLNELASLVGLSVAHFSHSFKLSYGVAPYRYVMQRRIERAKHLLRTTNDTITCVSTRVGFSSHSRFTRSFVRAVGAKPSVYRSELNGAAAGRLDFSVQG